MNQDLFEAVSNYRSQSLYLEKLLVYLQGGVDPSTVNDFNAELLSVISSTSDALNILLVELGGGVDPEPDPEA